jgi:hypothetical protein
MDRGTDSAGLTPARAAPEQSRHCAPDAWGRESGTARLEEAVVAYRAALEERTRDRVPLDWAMSFGNQGVALMHLAERIRDATMAESAFVQIEAALKTARAESRESSPTCCAWPLALRTIRNDHVLP